MNGKNGTPELNPKNSTLISYLHGSISKSPIASPKVAPSPKISSEGFPQTDGEITAVEEFDHISLSGKSDESRSEVSDETHSQASGDTNDEESKKFSLRRLVDNIPSVVWMLLVLSVPVSIILGTKSAEIHQARLGVAFNEKHSSLYIQCILCTHRLMLERGLSSAFIGTSQNSTNYGNALSSMRNERTVAARVCQTLMQLVPNSELPSQTFDMLSAELELLGNLRGQIDARVVSGPELRIVFTKAVNSINGVLGVMAAEPRLAALQLRFIALYISVTRQNWIGLARAVGTLVVKAGATPSLDLMGEFQYVVAGISVVESFLNSFSYPSVSSRLQDQVRSYIQVLSTGDFSLYSTLDSQVYFNAVSDAINEIAAVDKTFLAELASGDILTAKAANSAGEMVGTVAACVVVTVFVIFVQRRFQKRMDAAIQSGKEMGKAIQRFVPKNQLRIMGVRSIREISPGDRVEIALTMLTSDIKGFTGISETMTNEQLFSWLQSYFERMTRVTERHQGYVDKFVGDAIFCVFSSPQYAVQCGIAMHCSVDQLDAELNSEGKTIFVNIGIGIHYGVVMAGFFGDENRLSCTTVSSNVAVLTDLESSTRKYGAKILMSGEVWDRLENGTFPGRWIGHINAKGISRKIRLYEVFQNDVSELKRFKLSKKEDFEGAVSLIESDPDTAIEKFRELGSTAARQGLSDGSVTHFLKELCKASPRIETPSMFETSLPSMYSISPSMIESPLHHTPASPAVDAPPPPIKTTPNYDPSHSAIEVLAVTKGTNVKRSDSETSSLNGDETRNSDPKWLQFIDNVPSVVWMLLVLAVPVGIVIGTNSSNISSLAHQVFYNQNHLSLAYQSVRCGYELSVENIFAINLLAVDSSISDYTNRSMGFQTQKAKTLRECSSLIALIPNAGLDSSIFQTMIGTINGVGDLEGRARVRMIDGISCRYQYLTFINTIHSVLGLMSSLTYLNFFKADYAALYVSSVHLNWFSYSAAVASAILQNGTATSIPLRYELQRATAGLEVSGKILSVMGYAAYNSTARNLAQSQISFVATQNSSLYSNVNFSLFSSTLQTALTELKVADEVSIAWIGGSAGLKKLVASSSGEMVGMILACAFVTGIVIVVQRRFQRRMDRSIETGKEMVKAVRRFVPNNQLRLMGVRSIREVVAGDHTEIAASMLFTSIREFNRISESMTNTQLFDWLQSYFERMTKITESHHGYVDMFIGDALFCVFPSPKPAVTCGISMLCSVDQLNDELNARGESTFIRICVGIHHGLVVAGFFGDAGRLTCTLISPNVNVASRLEGACSAYKAKMLISQPAADHLNLAEFPCRALGFLMLKGSARDIPVYEVFQNDPHSLKQFKLETKHDFEDAVQLRVENKDESESKFESLSELAKAAGVEDGAVKFKLRCNGSRDRCGKRGSAVALIPA